MCVTISLILYSEYPRICFESIISRNSIAHADRHFSWRARRDLPHNLRLSHAITNLDALSFSKVQPRQADELFNAQRRAVV